MVEQSPQISAPRRLALAGLLAVGAGSVVSPETTHASATLNPPAVDKVLDQQGCPPYVPPEWPGAYEINLMIEGCWINEVQDINAANFVSWQNTVANIWARRRFAEQLFFQQVQQPVIAPVAPSQPVFIPVNPDHRGRDRGHGHRHR